MVNPTTTSIHADVGIAWDLVSGTTTTLVKRMLTRSQNRIRNLTGTTTGADHDEAIRALLDGFVVQNAMASLDPNQANSLFKDMRDQFLKEAQESLQVLGVSLDGHTIQFSQVNP